MSESPSPPEFLARGASNPRIAYRRIRGKSPGIVFCTGFMSDMTGSKALAVAEFARARGQACLRFDYSGHGESDGRFEDGTIGGWFADALAAFDALTEGPQVVVGSSMGGWIALLLARARALRVAALVGIAPAPDFTEDLIWAKMPPAKRDELLARGVIHEPSDYGEKPYAITKALIEDGRRHLLLRAPLKPMSIRWRSITPPMAARIDGIYRPSIHAPPRGSKTAFNSSTTKEISPPRRNTAEIIRVRATVQAKCSMFLELMKTSNGRRWPAMTMSLMVM
jgi:pimeloyl-ACP methyl ester carboxylesterase